MPYVSPRRPLPPGAILAVAPQPDPEPTPMPTVNAIPQDVTARSLTVLREFCLSYTFNGDKPYISDVEEDLIVDGLVYFILETWMPIMASAPNPGSLDGWEARRQQADAALQSYMRRRVGDVPQPGPHPSPLVGRVTLGEECFRDEGGPA